MSIPITQSEAWQTLQSDLGETCFMKKGKNYSYLALLKSTPVGNYLYLPYGPVYKTKAGFEKALADLNDLAREHHAIFIRVEPQDPDFPNYAPKNALPSKNLSPKDTLYLDLTQEKPQIISNFSQGTRTCYNNYAKKGITVSVTQDPDDIHYLAQFESALAAVKGIHAYPEQYLRAQLAQPFASLYLAHYHPPEEGTEQTPETTHEQSTKQKNHQPTETPVTEHSAEKQRDQQASQEQGTDQVIAATLFFDYDGVRYYMQSAADAAYRRLPATVALLVNAIFDAKEQGMKTLDFWGIAPDDADSSHPWYGFTRFKKSFGGQPVHYAGTYDLVLNKPKYHLYQSARRLNRSLRRKLK